MSTLIFVTALDGIRGYSAFHFQKMSKEGTDGSGRDIADQLLSLKVLEPNTDPSAQRSDEGGPDDKVPNVNDGRAGSRDKNAVLLKFAKRIILAPKPAPMLPPLAPERSAFVVGSMSHVVLHRAPNYCPLPEPSGIELVPAPSISRDRQFSRDDADLDSSSSGDFSGTVSDGEKSDRTSSPRSSGTFYKEENGEIHPGETPYFCMPYFQHRRS